MVAKAYELAQKSRALNVWAYRQLSNAEKNVHYTKRRLEVAELQVKRVIDAIEAEGGPKYRVVQYEPQGVPILPYVVEQDDGECQQQYHYETTHPFSLDICTLSVNGSDPLPVLMVPALHAFY